MRYSQIKLNDIANTDSGINISVWSQGCPHYCEECFNKETWEFNKGEIYSNKTFDYICNNINSYGVNRNLSILGGEPLCNQNVLGILSLCKSFKEKYPNKKIYLWTGYKIEDFNKEQLKILPFIDFLIDGRFEKDKKDLNLKLRGSTNQRLINVRETLDKKYLVIMD